MTRRELVDIGQSMCQSFHRKFLWIDHASSRNEVLTSFIFSMYAKFPRESDIKSFATTALDASVKHLCPENKETK